MKQGQGKRHHGAEYEERAKDYLISMGYGIVAQNVTYKFGEIDLVAEIPRSRGVELVFIEVRKRDSRGFLRPEETVTFSKQLRLRRAISAYLARYSGRADSMRIDLIAFTDHELKHYQNFMTGE